MQLLWGNGHWEKDCRCKTRGLSREEAQSERKGGNKKRGGKEKKEDKKGIAPSVSAIIMEDKPDPPSNSTAVSITTSPNNAICFYIACEHKWMLDSGCTDHITNDITDYSEYRTLPTPCKAYFADKTKYVSYIGIGTVTGITWVNGEEKTIILNDVLHSPEITGRFFLILKIDKKGFTTSFSGLHAMISKDGHTYAEGQVQGKHYWITLHTNAPSIHTVQSTVPIETLHARLGHLSWSSLQQLTDDIDPTHRRILSTCEGCLLGKSTQRTFKSLTHRRTHPFDLIHMDLAGPMKTRSVQGNFYHFIIVDDYMRYKWVLFLLAKSDTFEAFKNFHVLISTYYKGTLRAAHLDQGANSCQRSSPNIWTHKGYTISSLHHIHHNKMVSLKEQTEL